MIECERHSTEQSNRNIACPALELCEVAQGNLGQLRQDATRNAAPLTGFANTLSNERNELVRSLLKSELSLLQSFALRTAVLCHNPEPCDRVLFDTISKNLSKNVAAPQV